MSMDSENEILKVIGFPLDELSMEEVEQLRQMAERRDYDAMRRQLVHYSERFKEHQEKEPKP